MQVRALFLSFMVVTLSLSGCFGEVEQTTVVEPEEQQNPRVFVTDKNGLPTGMVPINMSFQFSDVGETGKEPSIGITSSGCIIFSRGHIMHFAAHLFVTSIVISLLFL